VAATQAAAEPRIEIVAERRRMHDAAFRAHVVSLAMAPGAKVHELARQHHLIPAATTVDSYVNRRGSTRRDSQSLVNGGDSDGGCDYTVGHIGD
jgi:transposase-like protein